MPPTGSGGPIERFLIRGMDLNDQQDVQDNGHAGTPIDDQDGGVEGVDGRGDGHEGDDEAKRKRHHTSSSSHGETDRFSESMLGNTSMAPLSPSSGPSPSELSKLSRSLSVLCLLPHHALLFPMNPALFKTYIPNQKA